MVWIGVGGLDRGSWYRYKVMIQIGDGGIDRSWWFR